MLRTSCTLLAATVFSGLALSLDPVPAMGKGGGDGHSGGGAHSSYAHHSGSHDRSNSFDCSSHHNRGPNSYCHNDHSYCHNISYCHDFCHSYCHPSCRSYCEPSCYLNYCEPRCYSSCYSSYCQPRCYETYCKPVYCEEHYCEPVCREPVYCEQEVCPRYDRSCFYAYGDNYCPDFCYERGGDHRDGHYGKSGHYDRCDDKGSHGRSGSNNHGRTSSGNKLASHDGIGHSHR
jgi:hypothetical protein